jgi:hypothetical protein
MFGSDALNIGFCVSCHTGLNLVHCDIDDNVVGSSGREAGQTLCT